MTLVLRSELTVLPSESTASVMVMSIVMCVHVHM